MGKGKERSHDPNQAFRKEQKKLEAKKCARPTAAALHHRSSSALSLSRLYPCQDLWTCLS